MNAEKQEIVLDCLNKWLTSNQSVLKDFLLNVEAKTKQSIGSMPIWREWAEHLKRYRKCGFDPMDLVEGSTQSDREAILEGLEREDGQKYHDRLVKIAKEGIFSVVPFKKEHELFAARLLENAEKSVTWAPETTMEFPVSVDYLLDITQRAFCHSAVPLFCRQVIFSELTGIISYDIPPQRLARKVASLELTDFKGNPLIADELYANAGEDNEDFRDTLARSICRAEALHVLNECWKQAKRADLYPDKFGSPLVCRSTDTILKVVSTVENHEGISPSCLIVGAEVFDMLSANEKKAPFRTVGIPDTWGFRLRGYYGNIPIVDHSDLSPYAVLAICTDTPTKDLRHPLIMATWVPVIPKSDGKLYTTRAFVLQAQGKTPVVRRVHFEDLL